MRIGFELIGKSVPISEPFWQKRKETVAAEVSWSCEHSNTKYLIFFPNFPGTVYRYWSDVDLMIFLRGGDSLGGLKIVAIVGVGGVGFRLGGLMQPSGEYIVLTAFSLNKKIKLSP